MSRAFVKEGDSTASGSLVDRFYQGLLGLSDPARALIGKRQQQAWLTSQTSIEAARRDAKAALGADSYREIFESAAERAGDPSESPTCGPPVMRPPRSPRGGAWRLKNLRFWL